MFDGNHMFNADNVNFVKRVIVNAFNEAQSDAM